ncbi:protein tramtrack, alpha isoform isoform X2 [Tribolium castaneum]|uniref:protein tramtrack, alpha isoform isoform X2 n=1 Tax=Tribolium castaneum TaxID=7070 RepID=UPI00046C0AB0|nr:PREDICTED: protein tramtrack, alpha isoform isoform X2 [Tribolium castaneum]|eukprot:XP_008192144.1 PREDICTED: protein tramtrack, alpha isoform isoform X2 [Tribolium castaneum]
MTMQQYCLRWNNHQPNFISVFSSLLNSESLVDVTLAAEGRHLQAHKVVLSACSSYFQSLFTINPCQHPIVILKDVKFTDLKVMVDFMYYGEVNVSQEQLPHILKTAEMLKIKGLAEIPVDQSVSKAQNSSTDKAELLTPSEANWSTEGGPRQSLSPSPCPLSPSSKRKRLRKSSTGSGSGSTERTSDEHQSSEVTLTSSSGGTVIKSDPGGYASDSSSILQKSKGHSSDSELHRGSSHESVEGEITHQVTLQVPQEVSVQHGLEASSVEAAGPSTTSQLTLTEKSSGSQRAQQLVMGTKRGRFLMRQPRIKRESDPSQPSDSEPLSPQYLSVPVRVERQCSEPLPSHSPPPGNLLTVPGPVLVKQHSHPLLPSQTQAKSMSPPLHIQIVPHESAQRAVSPVVVVSDPLAVSPHEGPLRADSAATAPTSSLRVRADELKRSASSPQTGTRSSHCPVVRTGPALGCNYCWNTVDTHGRILRRKTKYHCPECQTNLCIVPCFQEYHERHVSAGQTDPIALTTSVMRVFPKTSSM